jgi:hypothetical protein
MTGGGLTAIPTAKGRLWPTAWPIEASRITGR